MTNESTQPAVMWWDGGERAITAREKALIEEHSASSFAIPLIPAATPGARWAADGQADPHGRQYDCERAALTLGHYTDDELANAVFLHGNEQPSMAALAAGEALPGIAYLTAAKDRIRWLSRSLAAALASSWTVGQEPDDTDEDFADRVRRLRESALWKTVRWDAEVMEVGPEHFNARYVVTFDINENHNGVWVAEWQNESLEPRRVGLFASEEEAKGACVIDAVKEDNDRWVWTGPTIAAPPAQSIDLGDGVRAIAEERRRQVEAEGFSPATDAGYNAGELAKAALAYVQLAAMDLAAGGRDHIATGSPPACWPWHPVWWKPRNARRDLVRAGALIAAQLDVIDSARDASPEVARG